MGKYTTKKTGYGPKRPNPKPAKPTLKKGQKIKGTSKAKGSY